MKKLIILTLLMSISVLSKAQYHIRVECYGLRMPAEYQSYIITYTNDNWRHSKIIMDTWDSSDDITPNQVVYQNMLFSDMNTARQDAIYFAKKFKTFKEADSFNNSVFAKYQRLKVYRKRHPIKLKIEAKPKTACCKLTQIY